MKYKIILLSTCIVLLAVVVTALSISRMQTRVIELRKNNQTVLLVGVMHVGTNHYFSTLQTILDQQVVLFEGIRDGDGLEPILYPYKVMADILDIEFQGDAVIYRDSWVYSDVDYETVCQFSDCRALERVVNDLEPLKKLPRAIQNFIIGINSSFVVNFSNDPFVYVRNYKPILDALMYLRTNDTVAIFYGEAHIRHMRKVFLSVGFKQTNKRRLYPFEM